jgi:hypothetical protein
MKLTKAETALLKKLLDKAEGPRIEPKATPKGRKQSTRTTSTRSFWTDGECAYLRRKKANPAVIERADKKIAAGEYVHLSTSDDVEVYQIADWSNLKRKKMSLAEKSMKDLERQIVQSACKDDWKLYYDAVSEYAYRFKNSGYPPNTAETMLQTSMNYLEHRIMRRGGPTPIRIHSEIAALRQKRSGSRLYITH